MFLKMVRCDERDIDDLLRLQTEVINQTKDKTVYFDIPKKTFLYYLKQAGIVIGAYDGNQIVGYAVVVNSVPGENNLRQYIYTDYVENKETVLEIRQIMILPEYDNKGIQKRILKEINEIAETIDADYIVTAIHHHASDMILKLAGEEYEHTGNIVINSKYKRRVYVKKMPKSKNSSKEKSNE